MAVEAHIPNMVAAPTLAYTTLPAPLPVRHAHVQLEEWQQVATHAHASNGRLLSVWAWPAHAGEPSQPLCLHAAYAGKDGLLWLTLDAQALQALREQGETALQALDLSDLYPFANRMQRAVYDLAGLRMGADTRPWLNHAVQEGDYAFVPVLGDGVHEIAVGPVHAGVIEPGHFRFSVVGEKVLRLEERLGYLHRGLGRLFTTTPPLAASRLAARISGDSCVAYGWAYAMALESVLGVRVPERAEWLRALLLERERVANHLGDLGALANDAAFGFGLAQFMQLKEDWLRLNRELFGHRYLMDVIQPGGVVGDLAPTGIAAQQRQLQDVQARVRELRVIYEEHAGLQDRFLTTGRVPHALARQLGLTGLAGRASGVAHDLRHDQSWFPYSQLNVAPQVSHGGDVAARVRVRFDEVLESLRLIETISLGLPQGRTHIDPPAMQQASGLGLGWVEGWRGEVLVALELEQGRIRGCHGHDPSWQNWPVLEHAIIGNIVPDFPLINKSFNLSYAGVDL